MAAAASVVSFCSFHASEVLQGLDSLRLQNKLVDTKLCVDGQEIPCHRAVLSSCSEYFEGMFCNDTTESREEKVQIKQISYEALKAVVDFAYTADVTITEQNAQSLLDASNLLQVLPIKDACADFLQRQLDSSNCLGILKYADTMSCQQLFMAARKYALKEFQDVVKEEEFVHLTAKELCMYISDDDLNVEKEEVVYDAVMAWVNYHREDRTKALPEVMAHVRFPFVDPVFLVKTVETNDMVMAAPEVQVYLREARLYQLTPEEVSSQRTKPRKVTGLSNVLVVMGNPHHTGNPTAYYYNPDYQLGGWLNLCKLHNTAPLPCVDGYAVTRIGNNIMISGGDHDHKLENFDHTWIYEPHIGLWKEVAPMNVKRCDHTLSVLHGKVYAVGGASTTSIFDTIEMYCPANNKWSLCTSTLPKPVCYHAAVSVNGKIYIMGGWSFSEEQHARSLDVWYSALNNGNGDWNQASPLPQAMTHISATALQSDIYMVGCVEEVHGNRPPSLLCYKTLSDTWVQLQHDLNLHKPTIRCAITECSGNLFILQSGLKNKSSHSPSHSTFSEEEEEEEWLCNTYVLEYTPATDTLEHCDLLLRDFRVEGCVTILKN